MNPAIWLSSLQVCYLCQCQAKCTKSHMDSLYLACAAGHACSIMIWCLQHSTRHTLASACRRQRPPQSGYQPRTLLCGQDYLCSWPKTVVVVSHARDFLNTVATDIVHLHSHKLTVYRGNYDTFEKTASERIRNLRKQAESQQKAREHMQVGGGLTTYCKLIFWSWS